MVEDLDTDTLVELCILGEIARQCAWAIPHLDALRARLPELTRKRHTYRELTGRRGHEEAAFREVQAFLTCASIADSLLTGRGPPRPRGLEGVTDAQRDTIRSELALPRDFVIGGRPQRNGLVHIEERVVPWSRPGNMRGDFFIATLSGQSETGLKQVLRALDPETLEFALLGEKCNLQEVEDSLIRLGAAAANAINRILTRVNAAEKGRDVPSSDGPI